MIRPKSIVNFERAYLGAWLLSLIALALGWGATKAKLAEDPNVAQFGVDFLMNVAIGFYVLVSAVTLLLWYFAARQRAVVAKWIIVVLFALSLFKIFGVLPQLTGGQTLMGGLQLAVIILDAIAVVLLFARPSRIWFGEIQDELSASKSDLSQ